MSLPTMPRVLALGRWWSADELDAIARRWRAEVVDRIGEREGLVATALPASVDGVALFTALLSLPSPLILLGSDARGWRTNPALPAGTPVVLTPSQASLGPEAARLGLSPVALDAPRSAGATAPPLTLLQSAGVVIFTSGSTGLPRAVFRNTAGLVAVSRARIAALGLPPGGGILMGVSLASGQAVNHIVAAMLLGGSLGLLEPLDHRAALDALARPEFQFWRATPHFADVLGRCALTGPAVAPPVCALSSPVAKSVYDAFLDRFGVPLRQTYSSSETGLIAVDAAPAALVRPDTVGLPLAGVEVVVGEHPASPEPPGATGRIWVRSPWQMAGYGFPPALERPGAVDGWWPTRDLGVLDAHGYLTLAGRMDDAIRTRENRLVNLSLVATALREIPGVTEAVVVPLGSAAGVTFGAVVQCGPELTLAEVRRGVAAALPPWSWPRSLRLVPALPRLPNGRADRRGCIALLEAAPPS
jgi:acyl-CoA synthetase (AMP-forming)/AMP-acid ligase II